MMHAYTKFHFQHSGPIVLLIAALLMLRTSLVAQHACQLSKQTRNGIHAKGGGGAVLWSMDILHQRINLDLTLDNSIVATCEIDVTPREEDVDHLLLHLLGLTVDSVTTASGPLSYTHIGELLDITLESAYGPGDTLALSVHYHGTPVTDASGFGGFYMTSAYRYNLGVAFTSIPHSYGRAWFPCVDNFTERNSYEFIVKTNAGRKAWCNGALLSETALGGDTLIRHWSIEETIPAYLASVAASDYTVVRDSFPSISGNDVPVELVARAPDTTNMKNSFINLQQAFDSFESWFGPYGWNKVGYVLTPQGAMEHSTSIHYPRSIAGGDLLYEDIMAHELGHQWWGDLVTCDRAEEMYINEGFAEYLSYLFLEAVYGPDRYRNVVRTNHRKMVHKAHLIDMGWWTLSEVPQAWTYGEHSYNKGADVIHTLRGYLGDELFRDGLTAFLGAYGSQPVNSILLRDHLTLSTGVDMNDFFDDWILQPGWSAFELDSFSVAPPIGGSYPTTIHLQQKLRGADHLYHNVPINVSCIDALDNVWTSLDPVMASGGTTSLNILPPFVPVHVLLNSDERISLAITRDLDTLDQTGIRNYSNADLRLTIDVLPAPFVIRMEEYWVAADPETEEGFAYVVSPDRWWRVVANPPEGTVISGRITYDGRPTTSGSLDIELMQDHGGVSFHEDSLVLLYRPDQHHRWSPHPDFTVSPLNNPTDKFGRVDWNGLWPGEYTLGWRKSAVGLEDVGTSTSEWTIHPNPASELVVLSPNGNELHGSEILMVDDRGRIVARQWYSGGKISFPVVDFSQGNYQFELVKNSATRNIGGVMIIR